LLFGFCALLLAGVGLLVISSSAVTRFSLDGSLAPSTLSRVHRLQGGLLAAALLFGVLAFRIQRHGAASDLPKAATQLIGAGTMSVVVLVLLEALLAVPFAPAYLPSYSTVEPLALLHEDAGYVLNPRYQDQYKINSSGFRGGELRPGGEHVRVFCAGDSITFGYELDDECAPYPVQLQGLLTEHGYDRVEVVNAGVPGHASLNTLRFIESVILPFSPDLIVLCCGWNDLHASLSPGWRSGQLLDTVQPPVDRTPLALLRGAQWLRNHLAARRGKKAVAGSGPVAAPVERPSSAGDTGTAAPTAGQPASPLMPHAGAVEEYAENLTAISHLCRSNNIQLVVLNMPTVVSRRAMTPAEKRKADIYSPDSIGAFADALTSVCDREQLPCLLDVFDVDSAGKESFFLDWGHLNQQGCAVVARRAFGFLATDCRSLLVTDSPQPVPVP